MSVGLVRISLTRYVLNAQRYTLSLKTVCINKYIILFFPGVPNEKPWLAVFAAWGGVDKCHGTWKRGTCVFGVEDLPTLISKREMFANKFYESHQPLALECLNEWIEYKTTCPNAEPFDYDYYKSLPFIKKS